MQKSSLVLSGGGALGMAHLGAIVRLQEQGYAFDWYAGVSAGAIIAAGLACGWTAQDLYERIIQTKILSFIFDVSWQKGGLLSGKKVHTLLHDIFGDKTFLDTDFPLFIGATDFDTGARLVIDTGCIVDAVHASLCVPVMFQPFWHPHIQRYCVDGGLSHNFPVDIATEKYTGENIFGIDVATSFGPLVRSDGKLQKIPMIPSLNRTWSIFFKNQYIPDDPRLVIVRPDLQDFTPFDVFGLEKIWQAGYDSVG